MTIPASGRARRGFTLAQLTLCVAVIMAALFIAIPALKHRMGQVTSAICAQNLNQVYLALRLYRADNAEFWPEKHIRTQADLVRDSNVWVDLVAEVRYINSLNRFVCPEDPNAPRLESSTQESFRRQVANAPSYGLNQLTWRDYDLAPTDDPGVRRDPASPVRTILVADMGPDIPQKQLPENENDRRAVLESLRDAGRLVADDGFRVGVVRPPGSWLTPRHGPAINLMAMDGNVMRTHDVRRMVAQPPGAYYDDCATKDCTFCNVFRTAHYDFSSSKLHWWTGAYPRADALIIGGSH